jgi:hypothetical protein
LIDSISLPSSRQPVAGVKTSVADENYSSTDEPIDLSNYYSDLASRDLLTEVAQNVAESADALDSAMVSALENGMSVQDACNVNAAFHAYQANCAVLKSTFELKI